MVRWGCAARLITNSKVSGGTESSHPEFDQESAQVVFQPVILLDFAAVVFGHLGQLTSPNFNWAGIREP